MKNMTAKKGFTLIELLIVISIIGILAVSLLPSVLGAPARARDAARKADLNNIVAAIETYNADNNNYPANTTAQTEECVETAAIGSLKSLFSGAKVPSDPQSGNGPTACTGSGKSGYAYCKLTGNPAAYVVYTKVEQSGANHSETWIGAVCDATTSATLSTALAAVDAGPNTVFAVVK